MQEWQTQWGYEVTMNGHSSHAGMGNEMSGTMMDMGKKELDDRADQILTRSFLN